MHYFCIFFIRCLGAWLIHTEDRAKYFNFCGLPCARLEADKSVYKDDENTHPLTSSASFALNVMLFWAPQSHLEELRKVWVDECINTPRWKDFNKNLMTEWTGITIYVRIMMSASSFVTWLFPVHCHVSSRREFPCSAECEYWPVAVDRDYRDLSFHHLHHRLLDRLSPAGATEPKIWFWVSGQSSKFLHWCLLLPC